MICFDTCPGDPLNLFVERVMAKKTALMGRILRRKTRK
jgi:hypothetical protein